MDSNIRLNKVFYCFLGLILILSSCAQVGVISGGTKDEIAPKPTKVFPPNESLYFNSKKIVFEFDEYVKLNNALENITIVPKGIKVKAKVDKKKIILDLEGDFEANTTYQLTFNSAIKDITEGNDSLMTYVFSTGDKLDTLSYTGVVSDAYTGEKLKNVLVGLYQVSDTINTTKPLYFAKTDSEGIFKIAYLKEGNYQVYAFQDENKDLIYQVTEKVGFRDSLLILDSNVNDSTLLLISLNPLAKKITYKTFESPRLVNVSANYSLENTNFIYEDKIIEKSAIFYHSTDSLALLLPNKPLSDFYVLVKNGDLVDTLNLKLPIKQKEEIYCNIHPSNKQISKSKSFMLLFADEILAIDSLLITAMDIDSNLIVGQIFYDKNTLAYLFPDSISKNVSITFNPNSLVFSDSVLSEKITFDFTNKMEREFGSLSFKNINLPVHSYVEFILNGKVVLQRSESVLKDSPLIKYLEPGEYTFRIICDENENKKWDAGSVLGKKQAEKVLHFPQTVKIRANWETELEFEMLK
ncbi:MAG: Ig-like domain-containing domain [Bacteroidota bacterium]